MSTQVDRTVLQHYHRVRRRRVVEEEYLELIDDPARGIEHLVLRGFHADQVIFDVDEVIVDIDQTLGWWDGPRDPGWVVRPQGAGGRRPRRHRSRKPTRTCPAGAHEMPRSSAHCAACRAKSARDTVAMAAMALGTPPDLAERVIDSELPTHQKLVTLANWLEDDHSFAGLDPGPPLAQAVRNTLAASGYGTVVACPTCNAEKKLSHVVDGVRVCQACYAHAGAEECASCRTVKPVSWRDDAGNAWCRHCRRQSPEMLRPCCRCGTTGVPALNTDDGPVGYCCYSREPEECAGCGKVELVWARRDAEPLCRSCFRLPVRPCRRCGLVRPVRRSPAAGRRGWCPRCFELPLGQLPPGADTLAQAACVDCGRDRKVQAYLPDGPRCSSCYPVALGRRGPCVTCGAERRLFFTPGECADCLGVTVGAACVTCGREDRIVKGGECPGCAVKSRLDEELASAGERGAAVRAVLVATGSPYARLNWLRRSNSGWPLLLRMLQHPALTHEALDSIPVGTSRDGRSSARSDIEYVRAILIAADLLEPRAEASARFQLWAAERLATVDSPSERWLLSRYYRERLLTTVLRQERREKATTNTVRWGQFRLRAAQDFLDWLRPKGGLERLNRRLLDLWLAGPTTRYGVRDFVRWASHQKLIDVPPSAMPIRTTRTPSSYLDEDERAELARRCLHDEGLDPADRVAGALVVLYGQHLSRVAMLKVDAVRLDPARLLLGRKDWLDVPEPLDGPLRVLVEAAVEQGSPWLFPGARAGNHVSDTTLSERLTGMGIVARTLRNSALFHLAAAVQPHTLGRLLGLHPNTAVHWVQVAGGVYTDYWSDLVAEDDWDVLDDADDAEAADFLDELGVELGEG